MQHERPRLGLVEDDPVMGGSIVQRLELEGWEVTWWQTGEEAVTGLQADKPQSLVVCDLRLPDMSGEAVFKATAGSSNAPPFLFITGHGDIDQAVRLMRSGAADFMTKPFIMDEFLERIADACQAPADLTQTTGELGISSQMREVENLLRRFAAHDLPVLITGETGVGKEIAAHFLHRVSARASEPFMAVNCAAIPAELLESEIFGHEKGAFTGAHARHPGYAERAGSGTLFLDEIGDMPAPLQAKLLRLIENASFTPVGGKNAIPFRARIVAATHRALPHDDADTDFREDLYYRLAVLPVHIAPLRERPEDIPWLMNIFLQNAASRSEARLRGISAMAEEAALTHSWRGNVRELRNRMERATALALNEWLMPGDLFPEQAEHSEALFPPLAHVREAAERRQIERALRHADGQVGKAATLLSISRTTLWEKMTRLGIKGQMRPEH